MRDEAPAVNTTQPDFASNLDAAAIENLPINGRRWSNFALLTPTATLDGNFGLISFRGISGLMNNSTVDGADNNQAFFSEERGRSRISYVISQAAVREFQVNTSNFSAEYGRAAGAVVNAVTRSGGNQIHGRLFYYMRDNALGAANAFTVVPVQQPDGDWTTEHIKPLDRRQQFGGTLGGPIVKDKLFYFVTFDAQRRDYPAVAAAANASSLFAPPCVIPSHYAGMSTANRALVQVCGSDNSADELYTLTRNVMPLYSSDAAAIAAFHSGISYLASLLGPVARTAEHQIGSGQARLPPQSAQHCFRSAYNRLRWSSPGGVQTDPVVDLGIASFGFDGVKVDTLTARLTSTLGHHSPTSCATPGAATSNTSCRSRPRPANRSAPTALAPSVSVLADSSGFTFGTPATMPRRALPDEYRNQIAETVSWMHGRHVFKFGFDANRRARRDEQSLRRQRQPTTTTIAPTSSPISTSGRRAPSPILPGQHGYPTRTAVTAASPRASAPPAFAFHTFDGALFVQDDWRALAPAHPQLRPAL